MFSKLYSLYMCVCVGTDFQDRFVSLYILYMEEIEFCRFARDKSSILVKRFHERITNEMYKCRLSKKKQIPINNSFFLRKTFTNHDLSKSLFNFCFPFIYTTFQYTNYILFFRHNISYI